MNPGDDTRQAISNPVAAIRNPQSAIKTRQRKATRIAACLAMVLAWIASAASLAQAHTIHYAVEAKGMTVRVFYAANDPASYAEYELFGPGDTLPHQTGRTDKNGCVSFLPDRPGLWQVKVLGESSHGFHGVTIDVKVDQAFGLESFSKPLLATHTKLITGISLIIGLAGIYAYLRSRKRTDEPSGKQADTHS